METIKNLAIIIVVLILLLGIIGIVFYIYNFVKSILILTKLDTNIQKMILTDSAYIYFEYCGDTGIGKVYNTSAEGEKPFYMVCCIYDKTHATQHLELSKITKKVPIRFRELNHLEVEFLKPNLNYKK